MNELSTETKYAVILFHDGSEVYITRLQYAELLTNFGSPNIKEFTLNGGIYVKSAISKVLTLSEYYEEYPKKRPAPSLPSDGQQHYNPDMDMRSDQLSKNGLVSMARGLKKAIKEMSFDGRRPMRAEALMDKAKKSYEEKYKEQK